MPTPLVWPMAGGGSPLTTSSSSQAVVGSSVIDYGFDISTFPDLDESFAPLTGYNAVAQCIARSLIDSRQGIDLREWLNDALANADILDLQETIKDQCLVDERVNDVDVTASFSDQKTLNISIDFELVSDPSTFTLVLNVTSLSVDLISIEST